MKSKCLIILYLLLPYFACNTDQNMALKKLPEFDWQGHRGARGLVPENTVPAFLKALEFNIRTLEMDAAISSDGQVIISHEPWFSHEITSLPNGEPLLDEMEKDHLIHEMPVEKIRQFDVGQRGNQRFPDQVKMKVNKPTLEEVVKAVSQYCTENKMEQPFYNIEIKSRPEWDIKLSPVPAEFAKILIDEINRLGIHDRACIQSFDTRSLLAVNDLDKTIMTAYLIENIHPFEENMSRLDFMPTIYSPYFQLVTDSLVAQVHQRGMKLIPWTVNKAADLQRIKDLGVDGIITDYPNLIEQVD